MPPKRKAVAPKADMIEEVSSSSQTKRGKKAIEEVLTTTEGITKRKAIGRPKNEIEEVLTTTEGITKRKGRPKNESKNHENGVADENSKPKGEVASTSEELPKAKRGGRKKKEETKEVQELEQPVKPKGRKAASAKTKEDETTEDAPEGTKRRGRDHKEVNYKEEDETPLKKRKKAKPEEEKIPRKEQKQKQAKEPKEKKEKEPKAAPTNKTETDWEEIDFSCKKANNDDDKHNLTITSWNVDGLRAWLKKDGLSILKHDRPDILCLQETKCSNDKLPEEVQEIDGYKIYWCPSEKDGYAGVGLFSKIMPIEVKYGIGSDEHDSEGRCITAEYEKFYLVCVYVPNAGRKLATLDKKLTWNVAFKDYIKSLDEKKPVILCGDMNVAHQEMDLKNPKTNTKNAGFTKEEREGMTDFLAAGFVDTFRKLYPDKEDAYTFWSYIKKARTKNIGWRLDYIIISQRIMDRVCDHVILDKVFGSDHCPIKLFINL